MLQLDSRSKPGSNMESTVSENKKMKTEEGFLTEHNKMCCVVGLVPTSKICMVIAIQSNGSILYHIFINGRQYITKGNTISQLMRLWYLSDRRPAKAQASLGIRTVWPEPSLFADIKYGSSRKVQPKIRHLTPLDGCKCPFEE